MPPAATKLVIDNVLLRRPLPEALARWLPAGRATNPRVLLVFLTVVVLGVSVVSTVVSLWGRWRATLASKRVQVAVRRLVFEHAVRLPLDRIYQLKSGGAASLLREDAGGVGELIFSMLYNPWRADRPAHGRTDRARLGRLAAAAGRNLPGAGVLLDRAALEQVAAADLSRRPQGAPGDRRDGRRGVRRDARCPRLRPPAPREARFVAGNDLLARQELFAWQRTRTLEVIWDLLLPGASAALMLYGGLRVLDGMLSLGDLMMFLVYLAMLLEPLAVLATSGPQLQNNLSGFDRVLDLLAEPREMAEPPGPPGRPQKRGAGANHARRGEFRLSGDRPPGAPRHRPRGRAGRGHRAGRA